MMTFFVDSVLAKSELASNVVFQIMLYLAYVLMGMRRLLVPSFKHRLHEKDYTAQIKIRGDSYGRQFAFKGGGVSSSKQLDTDPDVSMIFTDSSSAIKMMISPRDYLGRINACSGN